MVGPGVKTGMAVRLDNPHELGADRLVNAVAAYERLGGPCVVVDFGTAITFDAVSADGRVPRRRDRPRGADLDGGADRARRAAARRSTWPSRSGVIGRTTQASLQSGMVYGFAGAIDAIARRLRGGAGRGSAFLATGGMADAIVPFCETVDEVDDLLTLTGLRLIHELNDVASPLSPSRSRSAACEIANRVLLAPLAGIGNWFVRLQARRHGAGLAVSEMVSSFGLHYRNERTLRELMRIHPDEHPVSVQLFGQDPEVMRSGAEIAAPAGADLIDINMGCPVRKVCKHRRRRGAALATPTWPWRWSAGAAEGSGLPVTVKLRSGLQPGDRSGFELAQRLADEGGVAAIAFHPRSAKAGHRASPTTSWPASWRSGSRCR